MESSSEATAGKVESAPTAEELQAVKIELEIPVGPQCYCGKARDFSIPDFQCSVCYKWFHVDCIEFNVGKTQPFMTTYHFMCKNCNQQAGEEVFSRKQANFAVMCQTALANLTYKFDGRVFFSANNDLIPYMEQHWDELTTQPRRNNTNWYPSIHKTLQSGSLFKKYDIGEDLYVSLANTELGSIGPSYERFRALTSSLKTSSKLGILQQQQQLVSTDSDCSSMQGGSTVGQSTGQGQSGDERKRKAAVQSSAHGYNLATNEDVSGSSGAASGAAAARSTRRNAAGGLVPGLGQQTISTNSLSGMTTGDEGKAKLNALGMPVDHPFNKEGYRYILVEPDRHAQGRNLWDDSEHTAGKPIPGLFYRVSHAPQVVLSHNDRATHLKLKENQICVTGEKGYGSIRATHATHQGTYYYECTILEMPEQAACRIGWAQSLANLQAPIGFDKFGYSWRSLLGTKFHEACGRHYTEEGYVKGDVVGCLIHLPALPKVHSFEQLPIPGPVQDLLNKETCVGPNASGGAGGEDGAEPPSKKFSQAKAQQQQQPQQPGEYLWNPLPDTYKDRPLIRFRNCFYFEEKDEVTKIEKQLRALPGAKIEYFRNGQSVGVAFQDIYMGSYFPALSIYKSACVQTNFGPDLKHLPKDLYPDVKPMSDRLLETDVEQCLADLIYLADNHGLVETLVKKCVTGGHS